MPIRKNLRYNGHPIALTMPVGGGGGGGGTATAVQAFTLKDWSGSGSAGFTRQGMAFRQGDIPTGNVPVIQRGGSTVAHQWSQVVTHSDGSWKFAVFSLRDTAFSASEQRSYTVASRSGTVPAGTGLGLSTVLGAHDLKAVFSRVTQTDNSSTTTAYGSGSFTASIATHAATSTRVTKMADGPVAPCWKIWGMAGADAHLKTESYVIPWLNSDGSVYAIELCMIAETNWWSIDGKYRLGYDVALQDGSATIGSWSGVVHPYGSHFPMVRYTQDYNLARAPWIGGTIPTLLYGFDKAYWHQCAVVPPLDVSLSPAAWNDGSTLPTLTPCRATALANFADFQAGIEGIDATGAVGTRGIITECAAKAFMLQDAYTYTADRAMALNTFHAPFHYRSNRTRTRPGESVPDTANSVCSLILLPKSSNAYDFTAAGLPAPVHAYAGYPGDFADNYITPQGGAGAWYHAYPDSSHLYSYSYMNYLVEGSPWVLESGIIDWAMFSIQQQVGQNTAQRPLLLDDYRAAGHSQFSSMPQATYTGLFCWVYQANGRAAAWAINLAGQATIAWDSHEASGFLRLLNSHNADWVAQSLIYLPSNMKQFGEWVDISPTGNFFFGSEVYPITPFFSAIITTCALLNYRMTGADGFHQLGLMTANKSVGLVTQGCYLTTSYRYTAAPKIAAIDFTSNSWVDPATGGTGDVNGTAQNDIVDIGDQFNEGFVGGCELGIAVGDRLAFMRANNFGEALDAVPTAVTEGQWYYVTQLVQASGGANTGVHNQVKVSATAGGTAINFGASAQTVHLQLRPASANVSAASAPPDIPRGDCYVFMHDSALALASAFGHPTASPALSKLRSFLALADRSTYMPSAMKV